MNIFKDNVIFFKSKPMESNMRNKKTLMACLVSLLCGLSIATAQAQQPPVEKHETVGPQGAYELLTPQNSALILIDHQPQMAFGVQSIDRQALLNNVVGLAKAGKVFKIPVVLTTVAEKTFSGPIFPQI